MHIRLPKAAFAAAALTAVAAFTGCAPMIENVTEDQAEGFGPVTSSVTVCNVVIGPSSSDCEEQGSATTIPTLNPGDVRSAQRAARGASEPFSLGEQLLIAYRVPNAYAAPTSVSAPQVAALTFARSSSYEEGLEKFKPSGDGQKWVGYVSSSIELNTTNTSGMATTPEIPKSLRVDASFTVPDGAPTLSYRPVVGLRLVGTGLQDIPLPNVGDVTFGSDLPADRPVVCLDNAVAGPGPGPTATLDPTACLLSPSRGTGPDGSDTNRTLAVRQLALSGADAPVSVVPGATVDVPFSALASGSGSLGTLTLTGTSTAPGATVTGGSLDLTAPSTTPATVRVTVPRSTPAGNYRVTASATRGGQTRSASRTMTVGSSNQSVSSIGAAGTQFGSRMTRDGYVPVIVSCPATQATNCVGTITLDTAGKVTVSAKRKLRLGKGRFRVAPGTRGRQKIKVNRKGRKALRKNRRLRVKSTVKGAGRPASVASSSRTFTLRPPK